jgi:hypothetical protein
MFFYLVANFKRKKIKKYWSRSDKNSLTYFRSKFIGSRIGLWQTAGNPDRTSDRTCSVRSVSNRFASLPTLGKTPNRLDVRVIAWLIITINLLNMFAACMQDVQLYVVNCHATPLLISIWILEFLPIFLNNHWKCKCVEFATVLHFCLKHHHNFIICKLIWRIHLTGSSKCSLSSHLEKNHLRLAHPVAWALKSNPFEPQCTLELHQCLRMRNFYPDAAFASRLIICFQTQYTVQ